MTPCDNTSNNTMWCCGTNNKSCCGIGATETAHTFNNIAIPELGLPSSAPNSSGISTPPPTASPKQSESLSAGAGAGIGIGVTTAVFGLLALGLYIWGRRRGYRSRAVMGGTMETDGKLVEAGGDLVQEKDASPLPVELPTSN